MDSGMSERKLQEEFTRAANRVDEGLAQQMLGTATHTCFRTCFHGGVAVPGVSSPSATALGGSVSRAQEACVKSCFDKFLEARQLAMERIQQQQAERQE